MTIRFSPLHLELLLHAYTKPVPWPDATPLTMEYQEHLFAAGLVRFSNEGTYYECTDKGRAHCKQLLELPLPTQEWVSATGKVMKKLD